MKLNSQIILRDDEKTIFSSRNMEIYELNDDAYEIFAYMLSHETCSFEEISASFPLLEEENFNEFLNLLIEKEIIYV